jgi:hypothetical protein
LSSPAAPVPAVAPPASAATAPASSSPHPASERASRQETKTEIEVCMRRASQGRLREASKGHAMRSFSTEGEVHDDDLDVTPFRGEQSRCAGHAAGDSLVQLWLCVGLSPK